MTKVVIGSYVNKNELIVFFLSFFLINFLMKLIHSSSSAENGGKTALEGNIGCVPLGGKVRLCLVW